jgi:hypothetical protein
MRIAVVGSGIAGLASAWLRKGANTIAVSMIARDKPNTLALDSPLLARLGSTDALTVSVEPVGGSPTGQPTGPVIAEGTIGAAPDAGVGRVAVSTAGRSDRTSIIRS